MKQNILIVDDHPGIQLLLLEVFTHQGYNVTMASTGPEALEKMRKNTFNVVVLDNQLPILTGLEVAKEMMKTGKNKHVILISGMTESLIEEAKDYPIVKAVIEKPFNITDLCAIVKGII